MYNFRRFIFPVRLLWLCWSRAGGCKDMVDYSGGKKDAVLKKKTRPLMPEDIAAPQ